MKPKLFLDVDGCLLVDKPVSGYTEWSFQNKNYWYQPETPARLQRISKLFDIVWASNFWHGYEDSILSPLFGLPTNLPFLDMPSMENPGTDMLPSKLMAINDSFDGPGAIVDDRMGPSVSQWAMGKQCRLIQPNKYVGLTAGDFGLLTAFGDMFQLDPKSASGALLTDFIKSAATECLFVYGTLKDQSTLEQAVGHKVDPSEPAKVAGYRRVCGGRDSQICDLVEDSGSSVDGRSVYVTEADLRAIDKWESRYHRRPVTLTDGTGATAYFLRDEARHELKL